MRSLLNYIDLKGIDNLEGYVVAPTGSGKTVIFAKLLEQLRRDNSLPTTVIVVPTKQLKEQTMQELRSKGFAGTIQLASTTQPQDLRANVIITTQNGFVRQLKNNGRSLDPNTIGLVIFDEAHHMQGEETQQVIKEHLPSAGFIGFTATPDYDTKRQLVNLLPDLIHEITVHEAVDDGLIAPYRTVLLPTHADFSAVAPLSKEYHQYLLNRAINTSARNLLITRFIADTLQGQKTVINVNTVEHAEIMAELLRQHGVPSMAVSGATKNLQEVLKAFSRGDIEKIIHARLLTEGFDEPSVQAVVNVSPTLSMVREKQRVGRGQRIDPSNPNKVLTIVECVDDLYVKKPRFYGGGDITGEWHYGPGSQMQLETDPAYLTLQDPKQLNVWWYGNIKLPSATEVGLELPEKTYTPVSPIRLTSPGKEPINQHNKSERQRVARSTRKTPSQRQAEQDAWARVKNRRNGEVHSNETLAPQSVVARALQSADPETREKVTFLLQDYDLTGLEIGTTQEARIYQRALKTIHSMYVSTKTGSDGLEEETEALLPSKINMIFEDVNNAIAVYSGRSPIRENGKVVKSGRAKVSEAKSQLNKLADSILPVDLAAEKGACNGVDPDLFFPARGASTREVKAVCENCEIQERCLHFALVFGEKYGIWGGKSERQRRRLRRSGIVKKLIEHYTATDQSLAPATD